MKQRARQTGAAPRPKVEKSVPEILVPASRKWRFFEGRLYFSTLKGYDLDEVLDILRTVAPAMEGVKVLQRKFEKKKSAKPKKKP